MNKKPDILMICLGNICRSPLAEGIMKDLIQKEGLSFTVGSAGTGHWHVGEPPHTGSIQVARKHSIDLQNQRSEHIGSYALEEIPYLCVMDESNYQDLLDFCPQLKTRSQSIWILRQFENNDHGLASPKGVPDPYYGKGEQAFDAVFQIIYHSCLSFLRYICASEIKDRSKGIGDG